MRRGRTALSLRRAFVVLPLWIATAVWLWSWWLHAAKSANLYLYIPLTFAIFYEYVVMPLVLVYSIFSAKEPIKRKLFPGKKVAIITPCVPSQESISVVERQLKAISAVTYPHDSWILDEGNDPRIKKLARKYHVKYFTRKGIAKYNQADYPFKMKTKAGNINAWLDKVKNKDYEFFVQMDIDHLPKPEYLDTALGHFRDKKVGWVQAPSVYSNLDGWTSRASAEQELGFHGPIQMALYGNLKAPVIVGSHTTFRMKAVREMNGFQPTRAEDHLNSLVLMKNGWNGVFIPEVIAEGDGPETLSAFLSQQYAWAFSLTQILKNYSHRYMKHLSMKRRVHYTFLQTWYPLWSLSYLIVFIVPILGLIFNTCAIQSDSGAFLTRFVPAFIASLLVWWASMPLAQPQGLNLTWRGMLLHVIRWPVILMAVSSSLLGRVKPYQVTPKGRFLKSVPTVKLYRPFLALSIIASCSILYSIIRYGSKNATGLLIFAGVNLVTMLGVCIVDLHIRLKQIKLKPGAFRKYWLKPTLAVMSVIMLATSSMAAAFGTNQQIALALLPDVQSQTASRDISLIDPTSLTYPELLKELSSSKYANSATMPTVGMYSPLEKPRHTQAYIEHNFYDWRENYHMATDLLATERAGNVPFITIEPKGEPDGTKLLSDINAGKYDETIDRFLQVAGAAHNDVYLRFGHEMDFADLYPWGAKDPALYIQAYRHVTDRAKHQNIKNIKWVWGPGGTPAAEQYYPGDDVVDVVGTTVLYDQYWNGSQQFTFGELVTNRTWLEKFGKPVWVTEFGAGKADKSFQSVLVKDAVSTYKAYGFSALVYTNQADSNIKGPNYTFDDVNDLANLLGLTIQEHKAVLPTIDPAMLQTPQMLTAKH